MLKHCLKTHPSCRVAMLFLSHQYRLLNLQVAEIQSLDLLQEVITYEYVDRLKFSD